MRPLYIYFRTWVLGSKEEQRTESEYLVHQTKYILSYTNVKCVGEAHSILPNVWIRMALAVPHSVFSTKHIVPVDLNSEIHDVGDQ